MSITFPTKNAIIKKDEDIVGRAKIGKCELIPQKKGWKIRGILKELSKLKTDYDLIRGKYIIEIVFFPHSPYRLYRIEDAQFYHIHLDKGIKEASFTASKFIVRRISLDEFKKRLDKEDYDRYIASIL